MLTGTPTMLAAHAAWVLLAAFAVSLAYEVWRATAKAGVSEHDTTRGLVIQAVTLYPAAALVIILLFSGLGWAAWAGLGFSVVMIVVSVAYYNPTIMVERKPGLVDWIEDLVFTGLLFVAATLLLYDVAGLSLGLG